jgi:hypothetical protein
MDRLMRKFTAAALTAIFVTLLSSCGTTMKNKSKLVENPLWITYEGKEGLPGNGKHIVLIAADQEYRSEESMPMLGKILSQHHGFDCTVLFSMNKDNKIDPKVMDYISLKDANGKVVRDANGKVKRVFLHGHIPGLDNLDNADLMIISSRFVRFSMSGDKEKDAKINKEKFQPFARYFDAGKPIIGIRTANHGFKFPLPYKWTDDTGKPQDLNFGVHVLGGTFAGHYGGWHREATMGVLLEDKKDHPILKGVVEKEIFGPSDVYSIRPNPFFGNPNILLLGQPLTGLKPTDPPNTQKKPLPIAWTKTWKGKNGEVGRVFHFTMGSARDQQSKGVRRILVNASYWCLRLEDKIKADSNIDFITPYNPTKSGYSDDIRKERDISEFRLK